jgi:hypothetical protein
LLLYRQLRLKAERPSELAKIKHWRGISAQNALNTAPVLEFNAAPRIAVVTASHTDFGNSRRESRCAETSPRRATWFLSATPERHECFLLCSRTSRQHPLFTLRAPLILTPKCR